MPTIEIPDWLDVRERTAESCVLRDCWGELDELRLLVEPFFERDDWFIYDPPIPVPDLVVTRIHGAWSEVTTVVFSLRGPQTAICEVAVKNDETAYRLFEHNVPLSQDDAQLLFAWATLALTWCWPEGTPDECVRTHSTRTFQILDFED